MQEPLIHISWLELKPNAIEHGNAEWFEYYYSRIKKLEEYGHIPESVFKQWIHPHHGNYNTLSNYAWMNFKEVKFLPSEASFETLKDVYVVEDFRPYVESRGSYIDFDKFCCIEKDLQYWKENGTWRVPPIILDNSSLKNNAPA